MRSDVVMMWVSIAGFVLVGASAVVWFVRRQATKPRVAIAPSVETDRRGRQSLQVRVQNLRGTPTEVRSAYLMFASGAGMALRPALPGSAPLPLTLPRREHAFLRYDFDAATLQLSHHPGEMLRSLACLVATDELVRRPLPPDLAAVLTAAAEAAAPAHLATCTGCSEFTGVPSR